MRSKKRILIIAFVLCLFTVMGGVSAREIFDQESCIIDADEVVEGDIFTLCGVLRVDGIVRGNIIGIARIAEINGEVDGGIYLAGLTLEVNGIMHRDLHFLGLDLNLNEPANFSDGGNLLAISLSNTIDEGVTVPGSVISVGYQLIIDGNIEREISFWGSALEIGGHVDGDVLATVGNAESNGVATQIERLLIPFDVEVTLTDPGLRVMENSIIAGRLEYTGPTKGIVDGTINGVEIHNDTSENFPTGEPTTAGLSIYLRRVFNEFVTLGLIGVIGLLFVPRQMQAPLTVMQFHPISTFGAGMLSFIISFPIVLIVALLSFLIVFIVGFLPQDEIALLSGGVLGVVNIGSAGLFYFVALYLSRVVVGLAIGRTILKIIGRDDKTLRSLFIALASGLLVLTLFSAIPVFGWIFTAMVLFLGLGAILSVVRSHLKRFRETPVTASAPPSYYQPETISVLPYFPEETRHYTPPTLNIPPPIIGTDNLPDGFDWWGEIEDEPNFDPNDKPDDNRDLYDDAWFWEDDV